MNVSFAKHAKPMGNLDPPPPVKVSLGFYLIADSYYDEFLHDGLLRTK